MRADRQRLAVAAACSKTRPQLAEVRHLFEHNPAAEAEVQALLFLEQRFDEYIAESSRAADPEVRQALRRGRRSNDLLREIEGVFRDADFTDKETAQLLFGNSETGNVQSIRDRRRRTA
jgi:hypothetical protein